MDSGEILESLRVLLVRGHVIIISETQLPRMKKDALFFGEIPQDLITARCRLPMSEVRDTWFLVTDQSFGSELTDNLQVRGVFIAEVDNLGQVRAELAAIVD